MLRDNGYSADVRGWLVVGEQRLPLAQVGPEMCILRRAVSLPPTAAELVVEIDGKPTSRAVFLTSGGSSESKKIPFRVV